MGRKSRPNPEGILRHFSFYFVKNFISNLPVTTVLCVAMTGKAVIIMGSEQDLEFSREIAKTLKALSLNTSSEWLPRTKRPRKFWKF